MDLLVQLLLSQCLAVLAAIVAQALVLATHEARAMRAHTAPWLRAQREVRALDILPTATNRLRILGQVRAAGMPCALVLP